METKTSIFISEAAYAGNSLTADDRLLDEIALNVDHLMGKLSLPSYVIPDFAHAVSDYLTYTGQVRSGGHQNFFTSSFVRSSDILERTISLLNLAQLKPHEKLVIAAKNWKTRNPLVPITNREQINDISYLDNDLVALLDACSPSKAIADCIRAVPELTPIACEDSADLLEKITKNADILTECIPKFRDAAARRTTNQMRRWLTSPRNVGLAIAASKHSKFSSIRYGCSGLSDGTNYGAACLVSPGDDLFQEVLVDIRYEASSTGVEVIGAPDGSNPLERIFVPIEEIKRIQKLTDEFRIPESVGLRWHHTQRIFQVNNFSLREIPEWVPGKFWLKLVVEHWGATGSPENSTFVDSYNDFSESLSQDDLARMATEAGISTE